MVSSSSKAPAGLLPGLLLAVSLHAFHAMAVVTVIPQVAEDLDGRALYGAFFSAYLLASLLGLVWAGSALASRGSLRVLTVSLAVFAAGVLASALAPSMPWLVAARVFEGFGGGGVSGVLYAVVNLAYAEDERPRVLAWMSGAWVLPGLLGPPTAGWLAQTFGWRSVFLSVLPAVAVAGALALPAVAKARLPGAEKPDERGSLPAAVVLSISVGAILFGLSLESAPMAVLCVALGVVGFVPAARRILPAGTLRVRPGLPAAIATKFLANFAFFGAEAFMPLALRELRGWSLVEAGTVLTASAVTWAAGASLHARLAAHVSARLLALPGALAIAVGITGVFWSASGPAPAGAVHLAWALAGLGMGVVFNGSTTSAMETTRAGEEGRTSSALGIADALGFALAAGLGGAVLRYGGRAGNPLASSLGTICMVMVGSAVVAALAAWRADSQPARRVAGPAMETGPSGH